MKYCGLLETWPFAVHEVEKGQKLKTTNIRSKEGRYTLVFYALERILYS